MNDESTENLSVWEKPGEKEQFMTLIQGTKFTFNCTETY